MPEQGKAGPACTVTLMLLTAMNRVHYQRPGRLQGAKMCRLAQCHVKTQIYTQTAGPSSPKAATMSMTAMCGMLQ